jgi:hypothetical protein
VDERGGNDTEVKVLADLNLRFAREELAGSEGVPFFRDVLDETLRFHRADGTVEDKDAFIDKLQSGEVTYSTLVAEDPVVALHGDLAVVVVRVSGRGTRPSGGFSGHWTNARVWRRRSEGWRCILWANNKVPDAPIPDDGSVHIAEYLWGEYQYRHDMIWKLAFRVTAVVTALLIAPFIADKSVRESVGSGLLLLPLLAIVVVLSSIYMLGTETRRFYKIRQPYWRVQNDALRHLSPDWEEHDLNRSRDALAASQDRHWWKQMREAEFSVRVRLYLIVLLLGAIAFFFLLWQVWLPDLIPPGN